MGDDVQRDALGTLTRLRAIETMQAQAELARSAAARRDAAEWAVGAAQRVLSESPGNVPVTYGSWLSHQLALRQEARAAEATAVQREESARLALVQARRAERIVEMLRAARDEASARVAQRREAVALDEAAARRAGRIS